MKINCKCFWTLEKKKINSFVFLLFELRIFLLCKTFHFLVTLFVDVQISVSYKFCSIILGEMEKIEV